MCSSIATFRSQGWASSTTATTGKSRSELAISPRCGRAASTSRAASRRSKARPRCSSDSGSQAESGTRDLFLQLLDAPQAGVDTAPAQKFLVAAALDHSPSVEHDDAARRARGAQPMRHEQDRATGQRAAEVCENLLF